MVKDAQVKIVDTETVQGTNILVPVEISDVTGENVTAYELTVECDPEVLAFTGVQEQSTLTEGWMEADNDHINGYTPHFMKIAAADATPPLSGAGTIVYLKAQVLKSNPSTTVEIVGLMLNETVIIEPTSKLQAVPVMLANASAASDGTFTIGPKPSPTIEDVFSKLQEVSDKIDELKTSK